jgi:hypothetical protein
LLPGPASPPVSAALLRSRPRVGLPAGGALCRLLEQRFEFEECGVGPRCSFCGTSTGPFSEVEGLFTVLICIPCLEVRQAPARRPARPPRPRSAVGEVGLPARRLRQVAPYHAFKPSELSRSPTRTPSAVSGMSRPRNRRPPGRSGRSSGRQGPHWQSMCVTVGTPRQRPQLGRLRAL